MCTTYDHINKNFIIYLQVYISYNINQLSKLTSIATPAFTPGLSDTVISYFLTSTSKKRNFLLLSSRGLFLLTLGSDTSSSTSNKSCFVVKFLRNFASSRREDRVDFFFFFIFGRTCSHDELNESICVDTFMTLWRLRLLFWPSSTFLICSRKNAYSSKSIEPLFCCKYVVLCVFVYVISIYFKMGNVRYSS